MRRALAPFWGKRYVLDTRNGVVHDLINEAKLLCDIDNIPIHNVCVFNSLERIERNAPTLARIHVTYCPFCMREMYE